MGPESAFHKGPGAAGPETHIRNRWSISVLVLLSHPSPPTIFVFTGCNEYWIGACFCPKKERNNSVGGGGGMKVFSKI